MVARPVIAVVNTGGTIASRYDPKQNGWISSVSSENLMQSVPGVEDIANVRLVEHSQFNGYRIDTETVFSLSVRLQELLSEPDIDGAVVVHGTATLEETAYLLDLTVETSKPVVVTGAQRRFDDPGNDGPANLLFAIHVAAHPESKGRGVLVALGGEIHAARDAIKAHTQLTTVFISRDGGPVGFVSATDVTFFSRPDRRFSLMVDHVKENVQLIKMAQGTNDLLLRACINDRVDGIVIEGFGGGHVNDGPFEAVCDAIAAGIPVVIATRVLAGKTHGEYVHPGSNRRLREAGAIPANYLSGQKARILLMVALATTDDPAELKSIFSRA
jgi:L-asparaginase